MPISSELGPPHDSRVGETILVNFGSWHLYPYEDFQKWGYPKIFRVYKGKSHLEMDDDWGSPYFFGKTFINICSSTGSTKFYNIFFRGIHGESSRVDLYTYVKYLLGGELLGGSSHGS